MADGTGWTTSSEWDDAQRVALLSAFGPCYLLTQIPGSFVIQRVGAKAVMTLNMLCTAALLLALPAARSVPAMAALLGAMGLLQGPFIPAWRTLQRNWMPQGAERAWAQRIIGQSNNLSSVLAPALTPYLAVRLGWQAVPLVYAAAIGAFALLWHATVTDHPPPARPAGLAARAAEKAAEVADKVGKRVGAAAPAPGGRGGGRTVEWRIFSTRPVLCCIAARVFSDKGPVLVWAPTYFMEALGCTPVQMGLLLAWTAPATVLGDFGSAAGRRVRAPRPRLAGAAPAHSHGPGRSCSLESLS